MRMLYIVVLGMYALPIAGVLLLVLPVPLFSVRVEELMITLPLLLFALAMLYALRENLVPRSWRR